MSLFFCPEIGEDQKKGLRRKSSGFLVQKQVKTKKRSSPKNFWVFSASKVGDKTTYEKTRSSPQISGVMVSHYNMVSPKMVSPGAGHPRPPPLATPLTRKIHESLILRNCIWLLLAKLRWDSQHMSSFTETFSLKYFDIQ